MTDLNSLSNEELIALANGGGGEPTDLGSIGPSNGGMNNSLDSLSTDELIKLAGPPSRASESPGFWESIAGPIKHPLSTIGSVFSQIPSGISNLAHLPIDIAEAGYDAAKLAKQKLFGGIFTPTGTNYDRLERTTRGIGGLGAGLAGAGAGTMLGGLPGGIIGGAASLLGFDWLNQLTGADEPTTPEQDLAKLGQNIGTGIVLGAAGKGVELGAKIIPKSMVEAIDRKSLGARQSDYGKASETRTIETPEGDIKTYTATKLNELLEGNELGVSRDPGTLLSRIEDKTLPIKKEIGSIIKSYDDAPETPPAEPSFPLAKQFLEKGQVPADLVPRYASRLNTLEENIKSQGKGKLSYLQQQKIALGKAYDAGDQVLAGFNRAIYSDLKNSIESYAPEIGPLNKALEPYQVVEPIVIRALRAKENKSPLTQLRDIVYTTGGVGAPAIAGTYLGGPVGTVLGAGVGLATKALASPTGQALIAKGLRTAQRGMFSPSESLLFRPTQDFPNLFRAPARPGVSSGSDLSASTESLRPSNVGGTGGQGIPAAETAEIIPLSSSTEYTSPSKRYGPATSAADILDDSSFISHYNDTIKERPFLEKIVKNAAGNNAIELSTKTAPRAAEKIESKLKEGKLYDETSLGDLIRGRINVPYYKDALGVLEKLKKSATITEINDYIKNPTIFGFSGINVNVKLPNGALGEIQIATKESRAIKEAIRPTYEKWRNEKQVPLEIYEESRLKARSARESIKEKEQNIAAPSIIGGGESSNKKGNSMAQIPKQLLDAVKQQESGGKINAVSPAGAKGLYQLMDATGKEWHAKLGLPGKYDPFDAKQNETIAKAYLGWLSDQFGGDVKLALASFNYGIGNIKKLLSKYSASTFEEIKGHLPKETAQYVPSILARANLPSDVLEA